MNSLIDSFKTGIGSLVDADLEEASARLLWLVLRESFLKGEAACRPLLARTGLADSFVDPACEMLERSGGTICYNARLRSLRFDGDRVDALQFTGETLDDGDAE